MFVGNEAAMVFDVDKDEIKVRTLDEMYDLYQQGHTVMLQSYGNWRVAHIEKVTKDAFPKKGTVTTVQFARQKHPHNLACAVLVERFDKIQELNVDNITARESIGINPTNIWSKASNFTWAYVDTYKRNKFKFYDYLYKISLEPIKDEDREVRTFVPDEFFEFSDGLLVKADEMVEAGYNKSNPTLADELKAFIDITGTGCGVGQNVDTDKLGFRKIIY